jgi:site-specific recombinase XerD
MKKRVYARKYYNTRLIIDDVSTRDAPTPLAHSKRTVRPCTGSELSKKEEIMNTILDYMEDGALKVILSLLVYNGARISEIISIPASHIKNGSCVIIEGNKGSLARSLMIPYKSKYLLNCKQLDIAPFNQYSRYMIYRYLKEKDIELKTNKGKHNTVTHLFRYNYINQSHAILKAIEKTAQVSGHKSNSSTRGYTSNIRN